MTDNKEFNHKTKNTHKKQTNKQTNKTYNFVTMVWNGYKIKKNKKNKKN